MPFLPDGTVIPSFLGVQDNARSTAGSRLTMSDGVLRVGEVIARYTPSAAENVSKVENEYIVLVNRRDGNGSLVQTRYRAVLSDGFGSKGDHSRRSLRARDAQQKNKVVGNGAIVLVACVNADQAQAIIISCLRHPGRAKKDPEDRFLDFEFNGVSLVIGDDGSFTLTVPGATTVDGEPDDRDGANNGSRVKFSKNGDIEVSDEAGESVKLSPGKKTIEVKAGEGKETAEKAWTIKAPRVLIIADDVNIGRDGLNPIEHGVVLGQGVDTLTGLKYSALGNASKTVKVKE